MIAEQLPIEVANIDKDKRKRTNIKILLKYVAALYVTPKKANGEIKLLKDQVSLEDSSFVIELQNNGSIHQILNRHTLELIVGDKSYEFGKAQLKGMFGENLLAGHKRKFRLSTPPGARGNKKAMIRLVEIED